MLFIVVVVEVVAPTVVWSLVPLLVDNPAREVGRHP